MAKKAWSESSPSTGDWGQVVMSNNKLIPSVRVEKPEFLKPLAGQRDFIVVQGSPTVAEVLKILEERFPEVLQRDAEGKLLPTTKVYVGDEDIRFLNGEATRLKPGCEIVIV